MEEFMGNPQWTYRYCCIDFNSLRNLVPISLDCSPSKVGKKTADNWV